MNKKDQISNTLELSDDRVIHQYRGNASNIYILIDKIQNTACLIDCGMPSDAKDLINVLKFFPRLNQIVCTHFHVDHVSGWICLKKSLKSVEILFHETSRPFVTGHEAIPFPSFGDIKEILIPCMKEAGYFPGPNDILGGGLYGTPFKKGFPLDRLSFFATESSVLPGFDIIHTPGHRPDSVSFFDPKSGILICGDVLVVIKKRLKINTFVEDKMEQENTIRKIKQLKGLKYIFPGHGDCVPFAGGQI